MAGSYREKFIPLFERATGLIKSGAIKSNNIPLWYNIYKAFPPETVPDYNRPVPNHKVVNILYKEDNYRAFFNTQSIAKSNLYNLFKLNDDSIGVKFVNEVDRLKQSDDTLTDKELCQAAIETLIGKKSEKDNDMIGES